MPGARLKSATPIGKTRLLLNWELDEDPVAAALTLVSRRNCTSTAVSRPTSADAVVTEPPVKMAPEQPPLPLNVLLHVAGAVVSRVLVRRLTEPPILACMLTLATANSPPIAIVPIASRLSETVVLVCVGIDEWKKKTSV
jgi:hypothetical protein